jgi:hypothetical protein
MEPIYAERLMLDYNPITGSTYVLVVVDVTNEEKVIITNYVSIASGHHGTPEFASFKGQETFNGKFDLMFLQIYLFFANFYSSQEKQFSRIINVKKRKGNFRYY